MKNLISLLLFIIIVFPSFSQDYQVIRENMERMYKHDGSVLGLRIDSVEPGSPLSGDTFYHGFYQVSEISDSCVTPYGPFWLGDPILKKESGDFLFHNKNGKTILIKNQNHTNIGDEWNCFTSGNLQNSLTIKAIVDTALMFDFLGLTDSVKVIRFQAYDENGDETGSPVNGTKIKISKQHGLIQTLPFVVFPNVNSYSGFYPNPGRVFQVAGMTHPEVGISNLTKLKTYDYSPGDEIHVKKDHYVWGPYKSVSTLRNTILKCLERDQYDDSINYTMERQMWYKKEEHYPDNPSNDTIIEFTVFDTIQKVYTPSPRFDSYPRETYIETSSGSDFNQVYQNYMSSGYIAPSKGFKESLGFFDGNDSCFSIVNWDGCLMGIMNGKYYRGLGGPYYYCIYGFSHYHRNLVYWKKGDEEWGEPITILPTGHNESPAGKKRSVRLYPNPSKDYFIIELPSLQDKNIEVTIFDHLGRKIQEYFPDKQKIRITHTLQPGIYLYWIRTGSGRKMTGKLIVK